MSEATRYWVDGCPVVDPNAFRTMAERAYAWGKQQSARSESERIRHFKVRIDVWYQPHKNLGKKQKPPERIPVFVIVEASDNEAAIKAATEWADSTAPGSMGRKMLSIEHRQTGPIKFPMVVES
jgi:hypothetical protein